MNKIVVLLRFSSCRGSPVLGYLIIYYICIVYIYIEDGWSCGSLITRLLDVETVKYILK